MGICAVNMLLPYLIVVTYVVSFLASIAYLLKTTVQCNFIFPDKNIHSQKTHCWVVRTSIVGFYINFIFFRTTLKNCLKRFVYVWVDDITRGKKQHTGTLL